MKPAIATMLIIALLAAAPSHADDWPMLGRTPARNPVVPGGVAPTDWNIGKLDRRTGEWDTRGANNIKWQAKLGSQTYGTPVVAGGQVYVGTNNAAGYLGRYPSTVDLGCLLCFRESDGEFLWQFSVEKHPAGRVHDWPDQGMGCTPLVEDERLWIVSNRWEVVCLDTQGFRDGMNDGPYQDEPVQSEFEADVIWKLDLIGQLGVHPHSAGMGPDRRCSIAAWGDRIYVVTGNGVDNGHIHLPAPDAPSLVCLNKHTGEVLWTDNSPGKNILHTQIASPLVAEIAGQVQVIVPQGDGWMRSFLAESGKLIWEFDINPKTSQWSFSRATRNNILATPVLYEDRIYVASGQEAEHGSGAGRLVCIDPAKSGDISSELAVDRNGDRIPHRRIQAVDPNKGEQAVANPNSGLVWEFTSESDDVYDQMHRTLSSVAVHQGLVIAADFDGFVHCLDALTGKKHWTYDTFANVWSAPLVVGGRVYVANEDGEVFIFDLSADPTQANNPTQQSVHSAVYTFPIFASGTLYLATRNTLYAIGPGNTAGAEDFSAAPQSQQHIPALRTKAGDAAKPRVPKAAFVPTPQDVVVAMLELAGLQADEIVCDLGSGDGRIPITAARNFGAKGIGYELDQELVSRSEKNATAEGVSTRVRFETMDLFDADLSAVDVVTIYLYPAQTGALLPRLKTLKAGARIIAHQYGLPGIEPEMTFSIRSTDSGETHTIYRYTTPLAPTTDSEQR